MVESGEMVDTEPLPKASPRPKSAPEAPPPCTITPSITYRGSALELMVACPRTRIEDEEPGAPEVLTAETPAARPCKDWSRLVITEPFIASSPTDTEAPDKSLFFMVP